MNSIILVLVGLGMIVAGYFLYSKYLSKHVYSLNPRFVTPAHTQRDGIDYVPTNKLVLWGHHFTSVAGAAPIVGPAIAVIWGWLPAFLWVTIGTVFFAGMHDMGALWASQRNKGKSIGALSARYIGERGSNLFMVVIFLLLLLVNSAFAAVISSLLVSTPSSVIPTWGAIVVALLVGQAIYRFKWNLAIVSVVGVVVLYALMILGDMYPIVLPATVLGMPTGAFWIVVLFIYAGIASMLPVWMLLQPRDYINGLQLFLGLGLLFASILISAPAVVAPAINQNLPAGTPSAIPLLFVTIACGAISGFHGAVASGTSAKQLDREPDVRFVGYFGAVGEGLLSLGTIVAVTSGFQTLTQWQEIYTKFGAGGVGAFVQGGGSILNHGLGIPTGLSATILATMAVLFAATTMDTGIRLQRFVVAEFFEKFKISLKPWASTLVALGITMAVCFGAAPGGTGGMVIWPLFGTTNQLLAGLTMSILVVILLRKRRTVLPLLVPLVFLLAMSVFALFVQLGQYYAANNWLLLILDVVVLIAALWVIVEAGIAIAKAKHEPEEEDEVEQQRRDGVQHPDDLIDAGRSE